MDSWFCLYGPYHVNVNMNGACLHVYGVVENIHDFTLSFLFRLFWSLSTPNMYCKYCKYSTNM